MHFFLFGHLLELMVVIVVTSSVVLADRSKAERASRQLDGKLSGSCINQFMTCTRDDMAKMEKVLCTDQQGESRKPRVYRTMKEIAFVLVPRLNSVCQQSAGKFLALQASIESDPDQVCESYRRYVEPPVNGLAAVCVDEDLEKMKKILCGSLVSSGKIKVNKPVSQISVEIGPFLSSVCRSPAVKFLFMIRSLESDQDQLCDAYNQFVEPPVEGLSAVCVDEDTAKLRKYICGGSTSVLAWTVLWLSSIIHLLMKM